MISSWMRLKGERDLNVIPAECFLKKKTPLEVKGKLILKLKTSESVSRKLRVKNGQCVSETEFESEKPICSVWLLSLLSFQHVFLVSMLMSDAFGVI